jgi:hypothetical protein
VVSGSICLGYFFELNYFHLFTAPVIDMKPVALISPSLQPDWLDKSNQSNYKVRCCGFQERIGKHMPGDDTMTVTFGLFNKAESMRQDRDRHDDRHHG